MFEAEVTANSTNSYVAIDDIKLSKQICGTSGDCTFELNMCYWKNQGYDDFDWVIKRANSGTLGPTIDRTLENDKGEFNNFIHRGINICN